MRWVRLTSDSGPVSSGPSARSGGVRFAKGLERPFAVFAALTIALGSLTLVAPAAFAAGTVGGMVFEDIAGNVLDGGEAVGDANNPGRDGVNVYLYPDLGLPQPEVGDAPVVGPVVTAGGGLYNFGSQTDGAYWVIVDSQGLGPNSRWAEQTYGPDGAWCADGLGATAQRVGAGPCYGGRRGSQSDALATWYSDAEHIARVVVAGGNVTNVDFGFSFNVITTTRGGGAAADAGATGTQTVQGSLRQFIANANSIAGANAMRFVPAEAANDGSGLWWRIVVSSALPAVSGASTTIDGTAYQLANGTVARDQNPGFLGANASGGLTVGVDGVALPQVEKPELELQASGTTVGLQLQANSAVVRRLAIVGFSSRDILVGPSGGADYTGVIIEDNVVGSGAGAFTGSLPAATSSDIYVGDADGAIVQDNLVGWANVRTVDVYDSVNVVVRGNELRSTPEDVIDVVLGTDSVTVENNLISDGLSWGLELHGANGIARNNTIQSVGDGSGQTGGIRLFSAGLLVEKNIITTNGGPGIAVGGVKSTAEVRPRGEAYITRNSFGTNAGLAIDLQAASGDNSLSGDGITLNDGGTTVDSGNLAIDFPVIDGASIAGPNLTVTGFARPNAQIEFYEAVGAVNDLNTGGTAHGEGISWLFNATEGVADADATTSASYADPDYGSDASVNRFSFTVAAPAGLVAGDEISATGSDGSNTSEFGPNFVVTDYGIFGTIFEDIAGNVLDGAEAIGDVDNPTTSGVDVYLYLDDGGSLNAPDATDTVQNGGAPVATDGSGSFSFPSLANGTYWVVVDSTTVSPSAGIHASYLATTPWADQTYGPDKRWCANGLGGTAELVGPGTCYGGVDGATDDDGSALATSEHIARVVISGGAVTGIDFGFSYSVVTNVEPAWAVGYTATSYQGSLDQFINNANSIIGANAMRFVPAVPTNASGGGGAWWQIDYTGAAAGETLGDTHDADTTIDGTAFDLADGVTVRDTNSGYFGANAAGGLNVGVADVPLPQVERPELEVMRSDAGSGVAFHFFSHAVTAQIPNNFTVRDLSTWGFVGGVEMTPVALMRPSGVVVERNVIGSPPDVFADPLVVGTLRAVALRATDAATVRNNLIGFVDTNGVSASDVTASAISGNEIRETGQVDAISDGVNYGGTSTTGTITGNLIVNSGGMGIDGTATGNLIENNTITGSGQGGVQTGGIRQTGSGNTIRRNVITGSAGPGVIVPDTTNANEVTENHFGANASIAIDLVAATGDTAVGDGITLNDGALDLNDGNDGLDFPIITSATVVGIDLIVSGFARPGVDIEFYEVVGAGDDQNGDGDPHGEGIDYLFTASEGSLVVPIDSDGGGGSYSSPTGYGADAAAERFTFTVPVPAGLSGGDEISAIAIDGGNTSEFGPNAPVDVNAPPVANPDSPGTNEDTAVNVDVMFNDTDADFNPLQIDSFDALSANGGTVSLDIMGTPGDPTDDELVYDPPGDFNGSDTFDYTISDGLLTDTTTVTVSVSAINDEPSFTKGADVTVAEDSGAYLLGGGWATGISEGPPDES
ncbi:MAG: right-handed parallel beta-helix repeat-containing protein, partial [Acidimicrobiia bacterium]